MSTVGLLILATMGVTRADESAPVHGFRVHAADTSRMAGVRAVYAPGPIQVFQQAPRVRMRWGRWSTDLQTVVMESTSIYFEDSTLRLGQTLLGVRLHDLRDRPSTLVLEVGGAGGSTPQSWGSHSVETDVGWKLMLGHERDWSLGSVQLTTRIAGGWEEQWAWSYYFFSFDAEAATVLGVPLVDSKALWMIHELEWQGRDYASFGTRLMARWLPGEQDWSLDVGGQLTVGWGVGGSVVSQVNRRF